MGFLKMESNIAKELGCEFNPIVLIKLDKKDESAFGPKSSKGGCVMPFVAQTIANRKTTIFGRENVSCGGIWPGFGWGDGFKSEKDLEFQATFLSFGKDSARNKETYLKSLKDKPKPTREMFTEGERIYADLDTACKHIASRPIYDEGEYVIFKAIENLEEDDSPKSVIFTVNSFELMLLMQLDGSFRSETNYLIVPQASACQSIGCFVFEQADTEDSHLVLGPTDMAARKHIHRLIPSDYVTVSMPWDLFLKLEDLSKNSVFQTKLWEKIKNY